MGAHPSRCSPTGLTSRLSQAECLMAEVRHNHVRHRRSSPRSIQPNICGIQQHARCGGLLPEHPDAAPIGADGLPCPPPDGWQGVCPTHAGYRRRVEWPSSPDCSRNSILTASGSIITTRTQAGNRPNQTSPTPALLRTMSLTDSVDESGVHIDAGDAYEVVDGTSTH